VLAAPQRSDGSDVQGGRVHRRRHSSLILFSGDHCLCFLVIIVVVRFVVIVIHFFLRVATLYSTTVFVVVIILFFGSPADVDYGGVGGLHRVGHCDGFDPPTMDPERLL
jgi:hypothetical protein